MSGFAFGKKAKGPCLLKGVVCVCVCVWVYVGVFVVLTWVLMLMHQFTSEKVTSERTKLNTVIIINIKNAKNVFFCSLLFQKRGTYIS